MNPRILLALAFAAALLIGLTVWLHVDDGAKKPADVELNPDSSAPARSLDELSTAAITQAAVAARAPVLPIAPAPDAHDFQLGTQALRHVITGAITSSKDGLPVSYATIDALPPPSDLGASAPLLRVADSYGHFEIKDPDAGRWKLTCSARGYATVERVVTVVGLEPCFADFVLTPVAQNAKLLVRLRTPAGRPLLTTIDPLCLEIAKALRPVFVADCPTRRRDLPAGTNVLPIRATAVTRPVSDEWFEVTINSKGSACCCLMLGNHVLDAVTFDESTTSVALVASCDDLLGWFGSVRLTVVDDISGDPITAIVEARPEIGDTRRVDTDARGYVQVDRLTQGEVVVHVYASLRAPITRKITLRGGETADLGVIRMVKTVDIGGWVERAEGERASANVFAYRIDGEATLISDLSTKIESNGSFTFKGASPGLYLLSLTGATRPSIKAVQEDRVRGWAYVDARFGAVNGVRIR